MTDKNPEPYILSITIYSDLEMLNKLIKFEECGRGFIDFSKDNAGRSEASRYYKKYLPPPKGYFRSQYSRYRNFEYFDYSPNADEEELVRVDLIQPK
jgi:hypothetical protein